MLKVNVKLKENFEKTRHVKKRRNLKFYFKMRKK